MADIITRLLLKTDDFDANLNKAKGSVNSFQGGVSNMAATAGAGVMKFAGAIGLAMGSVEAFNKTIGSTQTTGDAFAKIMDQSKASVDAFFTSIAMGNLDGFLSNLGNVVNKAGDLSSMMDELATKKLFADAELSGLLTQKRIQENISKDKTKSDKVRNDALEKARGLQVEINKLQNELSKTTQKTAYAQLDSAIAKQGLKVNVERETWDFALKDSNTPHLVNSTNMYNAKTEQIASAKAHNPYTGGFDDTQESKKLQRQFNAWLKTSDGQFAEFAKHFTQTQDEVGTDLYDAIQLFKQADSMIGAISDAELILNNTDAKINGSYKKQNGGGSGGKKEDAPLSGSLAWFDSELSKKNKELSTATTMQARVAVQQTINELEQQKVNLKIVIQQEVFKIEHGKDRGFDFRTPGEKFDGISTSIEEYSAIFKMYQGMIAERQVALSKSSDDKTKTFIQSQIDKLESTIKELRGIQRKEIENGVSGSIYSSFRNNSSTKKDKDGNDIEADLRKQIGGMKLPAIKSPINKKDLEANEEFAQSLAGIADGFGALGQAAGQFGEDGLSFALNSIGSIAQMIASLEALATAQGVASAFALPFPASLGAIATVIGTITSIFSSLPAFANGGIVPGGSFTGDKVHALVNSGEMILNGGQQSNLFRLLNGGIPSAERVNIGPQIRRIAALITPTADSRRIEVSGNVRVRGRDLDLALRNNDKITSKIR